MAVDENRLRSLAYQHGPILTFFLAMAAAIWSNRGVILTDYFDDMFVVLDLVWRSSLGQIPHVDFHSPIGQTFYWPFAIVAAFSEPSPLSLLYANLFLAAFLLLLSAATLASRLAPPLYFMAAASIIVTAIAPRDLDWSFNDYTHLAPYNRWGWSLTMLAAFISLVPRQRPNDRSWIDGIALGLILALLYYLKINFFFAAVGLAVIGVVLRQLSSSAVWAACATALALALALEVAFGNNLEYLRDISSALGANAEDVGSTKRLAQLRVSVAVGALYAATIAAVLWIWRPTTNIKAWLVFWWKPLLICAGTIGAGAVVGTQNHNEFELGLYIAATLIAVELGRRKLKDQAEDLPGLSSKGGGIPLGRRLKRLSWIPILLAVGFMPALDAVSVAAHAAESRSGRVCPIPGLRGTSGEALLVLPVILTGGRPDLSRTGSPLRFIGTRIEPAPAGPGPAACNVGTAEFLAAAPAENFALQAQQLVQGLVLLERFGRPGGVVLALNFSNPYPVLLRAPPPKGALVWWDRRTFSQDSHPNAELLLGSTDIVLQGKLDPSAGNGMINTSVSNSSFMWAVYGRRISEEFMPASEAGLWRLWLRKDAAASPALPNRFRRFKED